VWFTAKKRLLSNLKIISPQLLENIKTETRLNPNNWLDAIIGE
jgi:hypothetical protein